MTKHLEVVKFMKNTKIDVLGLLETRVKHNKSTRILNNKFGGYHHYCNYSCHHNGRIWLLWNPSNVHLSIIQAESQVVHCFVHHLVSGRKFHLSVVYGSNSAVHRRKLWDSMVKHAATIGAWRCGLDDLPGNGCEFTWFNKHELPTRVYSKLDRVLTNADWLLSFTQTYASFPAPTVSDHSPALLHFSGDPPPKKLFKFLNCWIDHLDYKNRVSVAWSQRVVGNSMHRLMAKLKNVKTALRDLHFAHFSGIEQRLEEKRSELSGCFDALRRDPLSETLINREKCVSKEFWSLKEAEAQILMQRAKLHDIKYNDVGSSYFFAKIKERQQSQFINEIQDTLGNTYSGLQPVGEAFVDYYKQLLGTAAPVLDLDPVIIANGPCLDSTDQAALMAPVTRTEIKLALFSIKSNKSPGIDGFSAGFFKSVWDIIEDDFCVAVEDFFRTGFMPKQTVMAKLVGIEQAAFVPGRSLHENVMLTQSLIKGYSRKNLTHRCLLKVDISKAFDSLQWAFIRNMLHALKFPDLFISWIMGCVTGSWFTLKINGDHCGFFKGRSGVRQGDPLSPLLFVLGMEILSRALRVMCNDKQVNFDKTEVYFGGVNALLKQQILPDIGLAEGHFPFRYLGLPLNPARLTSSMYEGLVMRIQNLVQSCASKFLSYAGKLQVLNSVVFGLCNFWCGSLVLPKAICNAITTYCRQLFWGYSEGNRRVIFKSWQSICFPWVEGGFQLKAITAWNQEYYSESLRGVILTKDMIIQLFFWGVREAKSALHGCLDHGRISVGKAYDLIRPRLPTQICYKAVQCYLLLPRYKVILQLAVQRKLATTNMLIQRGVHLMPIPTGDLHSLLVWAHRRKPTKYWKNRWIGCSIATAVYCLWKERNARVFAGQERNMELLVREIHDLVGLILLHRARVDEETMMIILEYNCLKLVSALERKESVRCPWEFIVDDISDYMKSFVESKVCHVKGDGNIICSTWVDTGTGRRSKVRPAYGGMSGLGMGLGTGLLGGTLAGLVVGDLVSDMSHDGGDYYDDNGGFNDGDFDFASLVFWKMERMKIKRV
ncbi:uncharacterized protein LOC141649212 [Silene latifolia]|uniref:uncharacterized protein LOC141649212 n=1 Tax=Silene latifolia TaxID=37657 RepID=UPI003D77B052